MYLFYLGKILLLFSHLVMSDLRSTPCTEVSCHFYVVIITEQMPTFQSKIFKYYLAKSNFFCSATSLPAGDADCSPGTHLHSVDFYSLSQSPIILIEVRLHKTLCKFLGAAYKTLACLFCSMRATCVTSESESFFFLWWDKWI